MCFVLIDDAVWSPLDEKPKTVHDVRSLARVRDILQRPSAALLVDHWSEDWTELAWVRMDGRAEVVESKPDVVGALRARYPQYVDHDLESRPMIRIEIEGVRSWAASPANVHTSPADVHTSPADAHATRRPIE